ncbi:hypothetical protein [Embleya scabrispora]|uniref:hypothetical protein n=1 Tax=Embleya scabrispora TaxID=159449 RepID=UPI00036F7B7F|nr:hypothetical protein [Embleya scabrispora]MYS83087.1 hypothetical protein [Streptomyces sp. SID5474]
MRITALAAAAATGALLALAAATPAPADGRADTLAGDTSRVGQVDRDDVLEGLRPAVVGIHQGISGGFVEVPPPHVEAPRMPPLPDFCCRADR